MASNPAAASWNTRETTSQPSPKALSEAGTNSPPAFASSFPKPYQAIEYGSSRPGKIAILTGSGQSAVARLRSEGIDTLVTGELRQHHFNQAQELGLNLYPCGHYATETFGVKALAAEAAERFGLDWIFIEQACPL